MQPLQNSQKAIISFRPSAHVHPRPPPTGKQNQNPHANFNKRVGEITKRQENMKKSSGFFSCFSCFQRKVQYPSPVEMHYLPESPLSSFNLETAVQDRKVMQNFELESLKPREDQSQKVKAPLVISDYDSKDCVNLPSSTAISRLEKHEEQKVEAIPQDPPVPVESPANKKTVRFNDHVDIKEIERRKRKKVLWATGELDAQLVDQTQSTTRMELQQTEDSAFILKRLHKKFRVKLIVVDLDIPTIDGLQLIKTIREQGLKLPILGVSFDGSRNKRRVYKEAGMTDFMLKPLDIQALIAKINALT